MVKLFLLKRDSAEVRDDEVEAFVVAAYSKDGARTIASVRCGDEGRIAWISEAQSTCAFIGPAKGRTKPGVILRAFCNG